MNSSVTNSKNNWNKNLKRAQHKDNAVLFFIFNSYVLRIFIDVDLVIEIAI